jgi:hypothetical protein
VYKITVGFEVLAAVSTNMAIFWVVAPCSLVEMEAAWTSETLINFYQTTRRYYTEGSHLHMKYSNKNILNESAYTFKLTCLGNLQPLTMTEHSNLQLLTMTEHSRP